MKLGLFAECTCICTALASHPGSWWATESLGMRLVPHLQVMCVSDEACKYTWLHQVYYKQRQLSYSFTKLQIGDSAEN